MKAKKKDIFRKLIKQAAIDKPDADFTDVIMKEIITEAQHETAINAKLKHLLQQHAIESPSTDFTTNVMSRLDVSNQVTGYKPVISKKAGYMIASVIVLIISSLFLKGFSKSTPPSIMHEGNLNSVLKYVTIIPAVYLITLLMVSTLLLIDYFLNNQILNQNKNPV